MSEKSLKFGNLHNKKEFQVSKKWIALNLVDIDKIVTSDKFKHNDKSSKYFIGCTDDNILRALCILLYLKWVGTQNTLMMVGKHLSF